MYTLTFLIITALMFLGAGFLTARNIYLWRIRMKSDFRENLKRMMSEKDITLRELAEKIAVSDVRMCKIATGDVELRPLEVLNMLIYFDCKYTEIFGRSEKFD